MSALEDVKAEVERQKRLWGSDTDDDKNMPNDWVSYISSYSTRWFPGGFPPYDQTTLDNFREGMVKVAALAVSAIEQCDRGNFPRN